MKRIIPLMLTLMSLYNRAHRVITTLTDSTPNVTMNKETRIFCCMISLLVA